ncbi:serine/threonine transporter SstT [Lacticaseibacillus saniviri]|uniref:serine/threonine transporter SstT n=1 Tax=Lacticaseibacillus saniviri TaxID=931533 RepID=UPI000704C58B|nr:serine/threonine transporter SstT [Lacticaseibacillus saniviri]MCG4281258.1 serine/threonine transporter SstT [Lacticaseibacillus saniviri]
MVKAYLHISLIGRIFIGLVIGIILGLTVPHVAAISLLGTIFVGALKSLAPILVFFLIMAALSSQTKRHPGFKLLIGTYLFTNFISALTAAVLVAVLPVMITLPHKLTVTQKAPSDLGKVISDLITSAVANPVSALIDGNYLAILFWSVLFGLALRMASQTTRQMIADGSAMIGNVAQMIIELAPFGVVGLVYAAIGEAGLKGIAQYGQLVLLLVLAMAVAYLVIYPLMVWVLIHQNPFPLTLWTLKVSGIPAFFTRSSAVNIPINMEAAHKLDLDESLYAVSIPLGASANSGGAAITIALMALVTAHTVGISVSLPVVFLLCLLVMVAATGISGIAGGSLLLIPMAASLLGIDNATAMQVVGVGFIIGVVQDSVETAVNSASDLLMTAAVDIHNQQRSGEHIDINQRIRELKD